ncbi:macro domain-containing protein [Microvirga massiliensis]|uniref:macro domain-containing protein n=1 Tax=Microvirga massiliensis TaxID=1033741 RepID=UPI00069A1C09|nr:macro domain-containing protein [Microvirga massiliensis]
MPVTYCPGQNIVESSADLLVNTVNCVGVAGKGVALAFKQAFPWIMEPYQAACRTRVMRPGTVSIFPLKRDGDRQILWAAFATKDHWRDPSRLEWVKQGLGELARYARARGVRSIALPPPGCGNGGLDWRIVEPLVLEALGDFDLRIYAHPSRP